jgi:hypothetical protein
MLGNLIANLDRPNVAAAVLTTLDPIVATRNRATRRCGGDDRGRFCRQCCSRLRGVGGRRTLFQLLTIMRKAENPGVAAIQAILGWVAADA